MTISRKNKTRWLWDYDMLSTWRNDETMRLLSCLQQF